MQRLDFSLNVVWNDGTSDIYISVLSLHFKNLQFHEGVSTYYIHHNYLNCRGSAFI